MAVRLGVILTAFALTVLVTQNDAACAAFLRDHGDDAFRGFAAIFVVGTLSYLSYLVAACYVGDGESRRRRRERLRTRIGGGGALLVAVEFKMIAMLVSRPGHQAAWLSWLALTFAILGFGLRLFRRKRSKSRERSSLVANP
jgi:hypothetical protein